MSDRVIAVLLVIPDYVNRKRSTSATGLVKPSQDLQAITLDLHEENS